MADYYSAPEVAAILGLVDTYIQWRATQEPPRGFEHYHPSAFGKCLRRVQYDRYVERGYIEASYGTTESQMMRIWENGHDLHTRWRRYFEALGILRGVWQCRNPICTAYNDYGELVYSIDDFYDYASRPEYWLSGRRMFGKEELIGVFKPEKCFCGCRAFNYHEIAVVSDELNMKGHCDAVVDFSKFDPGKFMSVRQLYMPEYLPQTPIVVDFKSCNTFDFQTVSEGNPHDYYITQLTIYANILKCDYGLLLYENKNNQKTIAFQVPKNETTVFSRIRRQAIEMNNMVDVEEDGQTLHLLPPPKPHLKEDKECGYCPFKEICHASSVWDNPELKSMQVDFYGAETYAKYQCDSGTV